MSTPDELKAITGALEALSERSVLYRAFREYYDGQHPAVTSDAVLSLTNASPSSGPLGLPVTPLPVGSNVSLTARRSEAPPTSGP